MGEIPGDPNSGMVGKSPCLFWEWEKIRDFPGILRARSEPGNSVSFLCGRNGEKILDFPKVLRLFRDWEQILDFPGIQRAGSGKKSQISQKFCVSSMIGSKSRISWEFHVLGVGDNPGFPGNSSGIFPKLRQEELGELGSGWDWGRTGAVDSRSINFTGKTMDLSLFAGSGVGLGFPEFQGQSGKPWKTPLDGNSRIPGEVPDSGGTQNFRKEFFPGDSREFFHGKKGIQSLIISNP